MNHMSRRLYLLCISFALLAVPLAAAERLERFALILEDAPAVKAMRSGGRRDSLEVQTARSNIRARQSTLRAQLESKGFHVTGSTELLLNAVYVSARMSDVPTLRAMPGVRAVFALRIQRPNLNAAVNLVDAPAAWSALGGIPNAGAGMRIGILDTGIDQNHPAFQDSSLTPPANYPPAGTTPNVPAYTNSKVIVARSYVSLESGLLGNGAQFSVPDDPTPRDRVGHGTAVAMCAGGNTNTGPLATITGLAPKAFLGNYKIFGSPGIIDGAYTDAVLMALDDAFADGMNVVNLSLGGPAFGAPLENDSFCTSELGSTPCDPEAIAVENAVKNNMSVVAAAGNGGQDGHFQSSSTLDSVGSPGYAPDAIAVAATGNSHQAANAVHITGPNAPANFATIPALPDDATFLSGPLIAPLVDAGKLGDVYGCTGYPVNSMQGDIALISRGGTPSACNFDVKLTNAQNAGAVAVLFYNNGQLPDLFTPGVGSNTLIPAFFIGTSDGNALKAYVDANSGVTANLDPTAPTFTSSPDVNQVLGFSSRGPSLGFQLKPDVAAPGENIYMATQTYDPLGALYDPSGYTSAAGTSFASPIVAGIAALVRQAHPSFTAIQVKSAIVNTATNDTTDPFFPGGSATTPSSVLSVGGGKAEALHAVQTNVTVEPPTISFGSLTGTVSASQPLTVTNFSGGTLTLAIGVTRTAADSATQLTVDKSSLTIAAGATGTVTVTLSGSKPSAGIYDGVITITGGAQPLHVPYLYLVGDGVPFELISLSGDSNIGSFPGLVGQGVSDGFSSFQVIDRYGVPVANLPVTWTALSGNGSSVTNADTQTNQYGEALAQPILGTVAGSYTFRATITGLNLGKQNYYDFVDDAVAAPAINTGGIVNAASNTLGAGIAPGSYISIYGTALASSTASAAYVPLPISSNYTSVAFDAGNVSVPGALSYVSATQINVQVPWELSGQTAAQIKVNIEPNLGNLITVPLVAYSPALFEVNGIAAATNVTDGSVVTASNAAKRGQYISLYCNGLGPVTNQPATGDVALANPLSTTPFPTVTIGGQPATVQFSGLAPNFVGLYQVNVLVPSNIAAGSQPIALSIGGVAAPAVNIPVQ